MMGSVTTNIRQQSKMHFHFQVLVIICNFTPSIQIYGNEASCGGKKKHPYCEIT
jgi:hypothetical protein